MAEIIYWTNQTTLKYCSTLGIKDPFSSNPEDHTLVFSCISTKWRWSFLTASNQLFLFLLKISNTRLCIGSRTFQAQISLPKKRNDSLHHQAWPPPSKVIDFSWKMVTSHDPYYFELPSFFSPRVMCTIQASSDSLVGESIGDLESSWSWQNSMPVSSIDSRLSAP